ncbi:hypothetical protein BJF82_14245 [Kytococcus sp. CUA-901]|nr:hypothetical protein BJF82_14245 [Kytococcus sp. CUA-901]
MVRGLSTTSQPTTATTTEDRSAYRAVTLFPLLVLLAGFIGYAVAGRSPAARASSRRCSASSCSGWASR